LLRASKCGTTEAAARSKAKAIPARLQQAYLEIQYAATQMKMRLLQRHAAYLRSSVENKVTNSFFYVSDNWAKLLVM
jgi:hypothetical protein